MPGDAAKPTPIKNESASGSGRTIFPQMATRRADKPSPFARRSTSRQPRHEAGSVVTCDNEYKLFVLN